MGISGRYKSQDYEEKAGETVLSIAVCDDELLECLNISAKIRTFMREMKIPCDIKEFCCGEELLKSVDQFDLIFLDILMSGMDGMETARRCRELAFDNMLVFLSSSRRYVFQAYDVEAFHYLVKPVEDEKLKQVLMRAVKKESQSSQDYMVVSRERQRRKLFLDHILYFEMKGRQVDVHEQKGVFSYYEQMGILERQLGGKGFFRCHKSYLVNLRHVEAYNRQEAILDNGERIMIAKRRYEAFFCYLAYAWCSSRFLKRHLCGKPSEGNGFWGLLFVGHVMMAVILEDGDIPYILYALCNHVLVLGLTLAVFGGKWEKKLLAAVMLETMTGLIWNFSESFFHCVGLGFLHIAAGSGQADFIGVWGERGILLMVYGVGITAVKMLSEPLSSVFDDKGNKWYGYLTVPLACVILIIDLVNWGASKGILVQDWGKYGLYENQLFSHGAMCIFTGLAMAAAGTVLWMRSMTSRGRQWKRHWRQGMCGCECVGNPQRLVVFLQFFK